MAARRGSGVALSAALLLGAPALGCEGVSDDGAIMLVSGDPKAGPPEEPTWRVDSAGALTLLDVEPDVVYAAISTKVLLSAAALEPPFSVSLVPVDAAKGTGRAVSARLTTGETTQIEAVIPRNTPPGEYHILVQDQTPGSAVLERALTVTDSITIEEGRSAPAFGESSEPQRLTIYLGAASPLGRPRAFLNIAGDAAALELETLAGRSSAQIRALAPAGIPPGTHDLVLVWQNGSVAVLVDAYRSVTKPLPVITAIAARPLEDEHKWLLEVRGTDFDSSSVDLRCSTPAGEFVADPVAALEDCDPGCTHTATFDTQFFGPMDACVVRVTNAEGVHVEGPVHFPRSPLSVSAHAAPR